MEFVTKQFTWCLLSKQWQYQLKSMADLKNSLEAMKRSLSKHKVPELMSLPHYKLQDNYLRKNNPAIFLEITGFIMVEYSPLLYTEILQKFPNIRACPDKPFIEGCYVCIRNILEWIPPLTIDQFLSNKYLEHKLNFVDELINLVVLWITNRERGGGGKVTHEVKKEKMVVREEEEEPRRIAMRPTRLMEESRPTQLEREQPTSLSFKPTQAHRERSHIDDSCESFEIHTMRPKMSQPQPQHFKQSPTITYPSKLQQSITYNFEERTVALDREHESETPTHPVEGLDYQSQINDLFELVGNVSLSVNQLVSKFNQFQSNVSSWVKNINAKVDILESTVKTIKDNL